MMRQEIPLSAGWKFALKPLDPQWLKENATPKGSPAPGEAPDWCDIDIPHSFEMLPFNNFDETCYQKKGTYCREFRTPEIPQNSLVFLEFEGVSVSCSVWL
ncbi:MAG: hypothetical protein LLF89_06970, partial [Spirochaetaceae bacterium]|nr:hypothetical protein [Spirochaetaceae bacterium]